MKALDRRNVPRNALVYDPAANEPAPEGWTTFLALFRVAWSELCWEQTPTKPMD